MQHRTILQFNVRIFQIIAYAKCLLTTVKNLIFQHLIFGFKKFLKLSLLDLIRINFHTWNFFKENKISFFQKIKKKKITRWLRCIC